MAITMQRPSNLAGKLESSLAPEITDFIKRAAETAGRHGAPLFVVGGAVRDLLLGESSYDIDLTLEGDAIGLASELTENESRTALFPQFGTA